MGLHCGDLMALNLLPWRCFQDQKQRSQILVVLGAAVILALSVMLMIHISLRADIDLYQKMNRSLLAEIAKADQDILNLAKLKLESRKILEKIILINNLHSDRSINPFLFYHLSHDLPVGLSLEYFERLGSEVRLTLHSRFHTSLSNWFLDLKNQGWMRNPEVKQVKQSGDEEVIHLVFEVNQLVLR